MIMILSWGKDGALCLRGLMPKMEVQPLSIFNDFFSGIAGWYVYECLSANEARAQYLITQGNALNMP
jgi:hypothetical protein